MKLTEMRESKECRKNLTGFLHFSDISKLNELFNNHYDVDKKSFFEICDKAIDLYQSKVLSNKTVSEIFEVLENKNRHFRIESHRIDNCGAIFEYDENQKAYLFLKRGTQREFNQLNHYL